MKRTWKILGAAAFLLSAGTLVQVWQKYAAKVKRIKEVRRRVTPRLTEELHAAGFALGDPVFIRLFKETKEMELWLRPRGSWTFRRFRTYPAYFSGELGPKLMEGDGQAPEGFYDVAAGAMNPNSAFHLSFNIGYPNAFDRAHWRTGSYIMVHGGESSIGCFAMSDPGIEEIYLIAEAALDHGQRSFSLHVFPFRMTPERLEGAAGSGWRPFWANLAEGYEAFEHSHIPPVVYLTEGRYVFEQPALTGP